MVLSILVVFLHEAKQSESAEMGRGARNREFFSRRQNLDPFSTIKVPKFVLKMMYIENVILNTHF